MSVGDKVSKKQWTTQEICTLIDAFREHRNLWQTKDANYKNRIKELYSYEKIALLFDTNWMEIDSKIKAILSQYQRERRNYKKTNQYPKWFGYKAMSFIHDKNKPRKGVQIDGEYEESKSSDEDPQTETQNSVDILSELEGEGERSEVENPNFAIPLETERLRIQKASTSNAPRSENEFTTIKIKNKSNINMEQDNESTRVFNMMKSSMCERRERDEYDVFGEMVAHIIRSFETDSLKISMQQQIANMLFDARRCHLSQSNVYFLPQCLNLKRDFE